VFWRDCEEVVRVSQVRQAVRSSDGQRGVRALAQFGLATRALTYVLIGWLAFQLALGHQAHQANQSGALAELASKGGGRFLVWVVALGFGAYALWRLIQAALRLGPDGSETGTRVKAAVRGVVYAGLCVSTFQFISGSSTGQRQAQRGATATVMKHTAGRFLVGLVGLIVVIVGVVMVVDGVKRKFEKELEMGRMSAATRTVVSRLGMIGTIARGVVFGVTGFLVIDAAITYDANKSTGLDGALRTLRDATLGPIVLGVIALGLVAFGLFGFASARWART
jgi:hypothetical protein